MNSLQDLNGETQPAGQFMILYFLTMMVLSLLLMWGIRKDIRGLMLPWMLGMFLALAFQVSPPPDTTSPACSVNVRDVAHLRLLHLPGGGAGRSGGLRLAGV